MTIIATILPNTHSLTYLQGVQRLKRECGVSGADPVTLQGTLPAEIVRLSNWFNEAWLEVQRKRTDWFFLRQSFSFTATQANGRSYTPAQAGIVNLQSYKRNSLRCYPASVGIAAEQFLQWEDYDNFRNYWLFGANSLVSRRPYVFTVDPQKNLILGPAPDADYVIEGEAYQAPQGLANDTDLPSMPGQFHMAIVYKAMQYYGAYENAPDVYDRGMDGYDRLMRELMQDQAPQVGFGGSLC